MNTQSSEGFVWDDKLVQDFAEQYRFSSSRISLEMYKSGRGFNEPYTSKDNLVSGSNSAGNGKDWEIISYRYDGLTWDLSINYYYNEFGGHTENMPNGGIINSVKRLSDGVVFSIGDEVFYNKTGFPKGKIKSFSIDKDRMLVRDESDYFSGMPIDRIRKAPITKTEALFKDYLGNDVFEGDTHYPVTDDFKLLRTDRASKSDIGIRTFKEETSARKYIGETKPQFSIKDFKDILIRYDYAIDMMEDVFSDLKYLGKLNDKK